MYTRTALSFLIVWSLVTLAEPVSGQEVNSDVKIPPPRELAAATEKSQDGSRPAWTGATPMALSASQRARSEALR